MNKMISDKWEEVKQAADNLRELLGEARKESYPLSSKQLELFALESVLRRLSQESSYGTNEEIARAIVDGLGDARAVEVAEEIIS